MHFVLQYDFVPDYLERRAAFRDEHLAISWAAQERGELILAGVLADPVDSALLVFQAESPAVVEAYVAADPYVKHGLVTKWRVRPWNTVVGKDASTPVYPG